MPTWVHHFRQYFLPDWYFRLSKLELYTILRTYFSLFSSFKMSNKFLVMSDWLNITTYDSCLTLSPNIVNLLYCSLKHVVLSWKFFKEFEVHQFLRFPFLSYLWPRQRVIKNWMIRTFTNAGQQFSPMYWMTSKYIICGLWFSL